VNEILDAAVEPFTDDILRMLYFRIWSPAELEGTVDVDVPVVPGCLAQRLARTAVLQGGLHALILNYARHLAAINDQANILR